MECVGVVENRPTFSLFCYFVRILKSAYAQSLNAKTNIFYFYSQVIQIFCITIFQSPWFLSFLCNNDVFFFSSFLLQHSEERHRYLLKHIMRDDKRKEKVLLLWVGSNWNSGGVAPSLLHCSLIQEATFAIIITMLLAWNRRWSYMNAFACTVVGDLAQ